MQSGKSERQGLKDEIAALKRERIIAAAVDLFYERGYENTPLDAVAERLGVTKPFIYSYSGSKAELLAEICSRAIRASLDAIDAVSALEIPPTEKLERLSKDFLTSVLNNQKAIAIFAREEKNLTASDFGRISDMRRDFDRKLNLLLEAGVASGEFELADPPIAALAIGGLVSWAYVWYRPNARMTIPELSAEIAELVLAMVGAKRRRGAAPAPQSGTAA